LATQGIFADFMYRHSNPTRIKPAKIWRSPACWRRFFAANHLSHALRKEKSVNSYICWVASSRQVFRYGACRQLRRSSTEPNTCTKANACHDHPLADWECCSKGLRKCRRGNSGCLRHCSRGCYSRGRYSKGCCSRGRCSKLRRDR